ncbi:glycosyl transferase [Chamberlinius hualienensis]
MAANSLASFISRCMNLKGFKLSSVPLFWNVVACITCLKFLLIPSYKSTDFEVHRNWLAITYNLARDYWYYWATSEWTLDYPPFFAWFEYILANVAVQIEPAMLLLDNLYYCNKLTVFFMRGSVIVTDLVYCAAVYQMCTMLKDDKRKLKTEDVWFNSRFILCMLLITNVGLMIVDHIHFQYNGFLFGILLFSINSVMREQHLMGAFLFAVLLNFKHIFLYMAPAYFVYLFRNYCFRSKLDGSADLMSFSIKQLSKLGGVVAAVFAVSFLPFIVNGHFYQIISRLFPTKRGLTHAYWAPNFWALYNFADKVTATLGVKLNLIEVQQVNNASMTGGLVKEFQHTALPSVSVLTTAILTLLAILPSLYVLWIRPNRPLEFLRSVVLCGFGAYMFGWHVHEKAILMVIIPMTFLAMSREKDASMFLVLSTVGHFSLTPLLFKEAEIPTKWLMLILYTSYAFYSFSLAYKQKNCIWFCLPLLSPLESAYLYVLPVVQLYADVIHGLLGLSSTLPFLPLMVISVYCALGISYIWLKLNWSVWKEVLIPLPRVKLD